MASAGRRSLDEVLPEVENIFELWKELQLNAQLQPLFDRKWLENKLRRKVEESEGSSLDISVAGGFKNRTRLAKLHRELMGKGLRYMNDQLTMMINCQKASLDSDTDPKEKVHVSEPSLEPLMSGALPHPSFRAFSIKAIGSASNKLAASHGLYLEWDDSHQALERLKGRKNETRGSPDFRIVPAEITKISCSHGYGKILFRFSQGIMYKSPLFVHLSDNNDADGFVNSMLKKGANNVDCQYFDGYVEAPWCSSDFKGVLIGKQR
ncbi:MAG: hypothetical protein Q9207_004198 [Kuettlingeria erythrocarpa]